jgi:diaminopimelate epimerase
MKSELWKFHGAGNDFLFCEADEELLCWPLASLRQAARGLCHRTQGVGADGLVLWKQSSIGWEILIFNSDGTLASTCGNALRCVGLAAWLERHWNATLPLPVSRLVPKVGYVEPGEEKLLQAGVFATLLRGQHLKEGHSTALAHGVIDVGLDSVVKRIPSLIEQLPQQKWESLPGSEKLLDVCYVELSNPHLVFLFDVSHALSLENASIWGKWAQSELPSHLGLPLSNVGLLSFQAASEFPLVVYERGAGLTQCCGSGAAAARAALEMKGRVSSQEEWVEFAMPGGKVQIGAGEVLRGPAQRVAKVEVSLGAFAELH